MARFKWYTYTLASLSLSTIIDAQSNYPIPSEEFQHKADLDENGNFYLFWKFNEDYITFESHVKTEGWFGLGFTDNGRMHGADIVIGWIKDGVTYFQDRHAKGNVLPLLDENHNYGLLEAKEEDGRTVFKFRRKLDTCDMDDYKIHGGTVRLIFSYHPDDPEHDRDITYHGATRRGAKSILLLDRGTTNMDDKGDFLKHDLLMEQVNLPAEKTYYHCKFLEAPDVKFKHHIVRFEPIIEKVNLGIVHHLALYQCNGKISNYTSCGFKCNKRNMPGAAENTTCYNIIYAWGVGQGDFVLPEEAGFSIGAEGDATAYMLEIHYDNPLKLSDVIDNSGLRFHYTDQTRMYDVGVLTLGHILSRPRMLIPPRTDRFRIETFCGHECTSSMIPQDGIYAFSSFLHTHVVGVSVVTQHIRNGVEQKAIARDDHYDFNYQTLRTLQEPIKILPGDELITTCVYDTSQTDNIVLSGAGTHDEMCLNFMFYYPKIKLQSCLSRVQEADTLLEVVKRRLRAGDLGNITEIDETNIYKYLAMITWDDEVKQLVQDQLDQSSQYLQFCIKEGERPFRSSGDTNYQDKVVIRVPIEAEKDCARFDDDTPEVSSAPHNYVTMTTILTVECLIFLLLFLRY